MSAYLYPLKLSPIQKSPIWSGKKLAAEWNKGDQKAPVGESWELSVRDGDESIVENGALRGRSLRSVIDEYGEKIVGSLSPHEPFPLLVKLIDAGDDLSVQVHPNNDYAKKFENSLGKSEMWYVLDAEDGAEIICGLKHHANLCEIEEAIRSNTLLDLMRSIKVRRGECYYIPAGLPHAIGRGVLVAEIQQNCDLTYRLYDYGRGRELHIKKALDNLKYFSDEEIDSARFYHADTNKSDSLLADCEFFRAEILGSGKLSTQKKMRHLLCVDGKGEIVVNEERYPISKGDSYVLPAALDEVLLCGSAKVIMSTV